MILRSHCRTASTTLPPGQEKSGKQQESQQVVLSWHLLGSMARPVAHILASFGAAGEEQ